MASEAEIIQLITDLTAQVNLFITNSKSTSDFPAQTTLVPASLIRVLNGSISEGITIQQIIDAASSGSVSVADITGLQDELDKKEVNYGTFVSATIFNDELGNPYTLESGNLYIDSAQIYSTDGVTLSSLIPEDFVSKSNGGSFQGDISVSQDDGVASISNSGVFIEKKGGISVFMRNNLLAAIFQARQFVEELTARFEVRLKPAGNGLDHSMYGYYVEDVLDVDGNSEEFDFNQDFNPTHTGSSIFWYRQPRTKLIVGYSEGNNYPFKEINDNLAVRKGRISDFRASSIRNQNTDLEPVFGAGFNLSQSRSDGKIYRSLSFEQSVNLFNKNDLNYGGVYRNTGVFASLTDDWIYTKLIPVTPLATYTVSSDTRYITEYSEDSTDSNLVVVPNSGVDNLLVADGGSFTVSKDTYFIIVSAAGSLLANYQLQLGAQTTFVDYYNRLNPNHFDTHRANGRGQIWTQLGDSLTGQNKITGYIEDAINFTFNNRGVGGSMVSGSSAESFWQTARTTTVSDDSEWITVMGMTNDWAQNALIGTDDSVDTDTYKGALNVLIGKLINANPTAKLVFITSPHSELNSRVTAGTWTSATHNTEGLAIVDYANAMKEICEIYNLPVIDVYTKCGFNTLNLSTYMDDDASGESLIHPNMEFGAKRIASIIIGEMKMMMENNLNNINF